VVGFTFIILLRTKSVIVTMWLRLKMSINMSSEESTLYPTKRKQIS